MFACLIGFLAHIFVQNFPFSQISAFLVVQGQIDRTYFLSAPHFLEHLCGESEIFFTLYFLDIFRLPFFFTPMRLYPSLSFFPLRDEHFKGYFFSVSPNPCRAVNFFNLYHIPIFFVMHSYAKLCT